MVEIKKDKFEECYGQLYDRTIREVTRFDTTEISFATGYWYEQEGYKYAIWENGNRALMLDNWETEKEKPEYIIDRVKDAIAVTDESGQMQNLITQNDYINLMLNVFPKKKELSEILFALYKTNDDEKTFNDLANLLKGKSIHDPFSVVAYLFFLKDKEKYVPVKVHGNQISLKKLGLKDDCVKVCSWHNYQMFLDIIKELQELLQERLCSNVTLLDAQSFLWMLQMNLEPSVGLPEKVEENETVVQYEGREGRIIRYYVKRYERNRKNHDEAIRIHGHKCMACEFDFSKVYGEYADNYIEVHHIVPLSTYKEEVSVNPKTDLICLCANCHRMIHHKNNAILTLDELKELIKCQKEKI